MIMENDKPDFAANAGFPNGLDLEEPSDYLAAMAALFPEWLSPEDEAAFANL